MGNYLSLCLLVSVFGVFLAFLAVSGRIQRVVVLSHRCNNGRAKSRWNRPETAKNAKKTP